MEVEARVLEVIKDLAGQQSRLAIGDITSAFIERYGREYDRPITSRWMGHLIRRKLQIKTRKSDGVFAIPLAEHARLRHLYDKYGIGVTPDVLPEGEDIMDVRDIGADADIE